jgi:hypothetical protein
MTIINQISVNGDEETVFNLSSLQLFKSNHHTSVLPELFLPGFRILFHDGDKLANLK